ncbi:TrkH family potassium uptake protein [Andreprevotia chitinilytica]|uniref:TrkH family potassium uptake protein n=1 Tax=Andreprevotia chitinilytica TaxID=396808 RepID=UPI000557D9E9|nr:TrkH family potassium uptake protein [Andreprevotia chitinilytica]
MRAAYRLLPVVNVLARVALVFSFTLLAPIGLAWWNNDAGLIPFLHALVGLVVVSTALMLVTRFARRELKPRDGFVLVVGLWTTLPAVAAVPLLLYNPQLSFTHAYFEAMSGLSTTGATALSGIDHLPQSINLWRHLLNWLGGMGIIVLAIAVLPMLGVGGMQLFKAEAPGPMKDAKLTPRIHETARSLWLIYTGFTVLCALLLRYVGGLTWFDAVCHALSTLCIGGFSTHDASVGYFQSPTVEIILIAFMLIGATNFATHYRALTGRSLRAYWRDSEFKAMVLLNVVSVLLLAAYLVKQQTYGDYATSLRHVAFNAVAVATGGGFASVDFGQWPLVVPLWMLLLSCLSTCSGSTGGGLKMIRVLILLRESGRQFALLLHPNAVRPLRVNGMAISNSVVFAVLGFVFLYVLCVVLLTFALLLSGLDFISSFSAVLACINNAGPGLGVVGPSSNYGVLSDVQVWICSTAMLLGRLEIISLLILFSPAFWRN